MVLLTFALGINACSLDSVKGHGGSCPPKGEDGVLQKIYKSAEDIIERDTSHISFGTNFEYNNCPEDYICALNSDNEAVCMTGTCAENQIVCDGKCIDPLQDRDYCGAKAGNDCPDGFSCCKQYKKCDVGEYCIDGKCTLPRCVENVELCMFGKRYECKKNKSGGFDTSVIEECESGVCSTDFECATANSCKIGDKLCRDGMIYHCKTGDKWSSGDQCESGICKSIEACAEPAPCRNDEKRCVSKAIYTCRNNTWERTSTCTSEEICDSGECKTNMSCNSSQCIKTEDGRYNHRKCEKGKVVDEVTCGNSHICLDDAGCVECTNKQTRCTDGQTYQICSSNKWSDKENCGSQEKKCLADHGCVECSKGEFKCSDDAYYQCSSDYKWELKDNCKQKNLLCDPALGCVETIVSECQIDEQKCDMGKDYVCKTEGSSYKWTMREDCLAKDKICENAVGCITKDCDLDTTKCASDIFYKCKKEGNALRWTEEENCAASQKMCKTGVGCQKREETAACAGAVLTITQEDGTTKKENCGAQNKICDSTQKKCIPATTIECESNSAKVVLKAGNLQNTYNCSDNAMLTNEEIQSYGIPESPDMVRNKIFCNPLSGCNYFYCKGDTMYRKIEDDYESSCDNTDERDICTINCKGENGHPMAFCSNAYDMCALCEPGKFTKKCEVNDMDETVYLRECILSRDTMSIDPSIDLFSGNDFQYNIAVDICDCEKSTCCKDSTGCVK